MSEYAQRFNLSASLAASITNLSAWLSSTLLLTLLAVVSHAHHTLSATRTAVPMPDLIAAVTWPLLAVTVSAAAALLLSIPVSANLARKSQRQRPPQLRATAASGTKVTSDSALAAASGGAASSTAPKGMADSVASDGEARGQSLSGVSPVASSGGKQELAQQPDEGSMSDPSTLASNHSSASEADSESQMHSDMGRTVEPEVSGSTTEQQTPPEQQLPGMSPEPDSKRRKGFFRDIESDCLMTRRQTQFACRLKPHGFGNHRVARTRRQWPLRSCMHFASCCLRHDSMYSHTSMVR